MMPTKSSGGAFYFDKPIHGSVINTNQNKNDFYIILNSHSRQLQGHRKQYFLK